MAADLFCTLYMPCLALVLLLLFCLRLLLAELSRLPELLFLTCPYSMLLLEPCFDATARLETVVVFPDLLAPWLTLTALRR